MQGVHDRYDLIVANIANGDVIGHTTSQAAKVRCAAVVDAHLGEIVEQAFAGEYVVLVTADHGNLEVMLQADGSPHVSHTDNPVPFLYLEGRKAPGLHVRDGSLADVAPTVLRLLGIEPPHEMNGQCLLPSVRWHAGRRVLLLILDGWGIGRQDSANPIFLAQPEVWGRLIREHPTSQLLASGRGRGIGTRQGGQFGSRPHEPGRRPAGPTG